MFILFFNDLICDRNALLGGVFAKLVLGDVDSVLLLRWLHVKWLFFLFVGLGCLQVLFDLDLLCVLVELRLGVIHGLELLGLGSWLDVLK